MKNKFNKIKERINKVFLTLGTASATASILVSEAFAAGANEIGNAAGFGGQNFQQNLKGGAINLITGAAGIIGLIWMGFGIFNLIMAIRNEDADGRNKAILNLVAGGILSGIGVVLGMFGFTAA